MVNEPFITYKLLTVLKNKLLTALGKTERFRKNSVVKELLLSVDFNHSLQVYGSFEKRKGRKLAWL